MADYQAKINLLVSGQAQLKALTRELKSANEEAEALKRKAQSLGGVASRARQVLGVTGRDQPRGEKGRFAKDPNRASRLNALQSERGAKRAAFLANRAAKLQFAATRGVQKQIEGQKQLNNLVAKQTRTQIDLNKTTDLFETRLAKLRRGRVEDSKVNQPEIDAIRASSQQLQQAFKAALAGGEANLQLLKTTADAMGKLVERQNELNRLSKLRSKGFEKGRRLQERVDTLAESGRFAPQKVRQARALSTEVITAANVGDATKYANALGKAEAFIRRQEEFLGKVRAGQKSINVAQRSLNKLKSLELADQKLIAAVQGKLSKANVEALKGNLIKARQITDEVIEEVNAHKAVVAELKRANVQRDRGLARTRKQAAIDAKEAKAAKARERQKTGRIGTNVALGAGFPLLFGGGPGSVLGGIVGGLFGGMGGSVIGGALGQQFDKLGAAALSTGKAFNKASDNIDKFVSLIGQNGSSGFAGRAEFLSSQGLSSQVAVAAIQEFEKVYGTEARKKFEELGRTSKEFDNVMNDIGVTLQGLMAGPLKGLLDIIKQITGAGTREPQGQEASKQRFQEKADTAAIGIANLATKVQGMEPGDERFRVEQQLNTLIHERNSFLAIAADYNNRAANKTGEILSLEKLLTNEVQKRKQLQADETAIVRDRLTARRDTLATMQADLDLNKATADVEKLRAELNAEISLSGELSTKSLAIQDNLNKAIGVQNRARLNGANNILLTQRAINREVVNNEMATMASRQALDSVNNSLSAFQKTAVERYEDELTLIQSQFFITADLLDIKERIEKTGINEKEIIDAITVKYEMLRNLEKERAELATETARQRELERLDVQQQIKDQAALNNLKAASSAEKQIRSFSPETTREFLGTGFGFFDGSSRLEAELGEDRIRQTQAYSLEIQALTDRIADLREKGGDVKLIATKQKDLEEVQRLADNYAKLQPGIDAARVSQEQFNEAFALTAPAVSSVVNGLSEVIQGTQTATEAFANFLRTIGDMLVQEGTRMIATYIAIGIAKAFAGMSGGFNSSAASPGGSAGVSGIGGGMNNPFGNTSSFGAPVSLKANGGPVSGGQPYMVGERGPELFVPGQSGGVMRNEDMRSLMGRSPASGGAPSMSFSFETTSIGGTEYVSREQLEAAMAVTRKQASNDGAKRGMNMTLDKMQNSPRTRTRIGLR